MVSHDSYSQARSIDRPDPDRLISSTVNASEQGVEQTDEDLLHRFRVADDSRAFETLVHRYEHELFSYLRRYLGSAEMAEDVFQATFLQVHLKREHFEDGRRFRPWLYTIATNQAIDAQRRNRRHRMVSIDQRVGGENDLGAACGDAGGPRTDSGRAIGRRGIKAVGAIGCQRTSRIAEGRITVGLSSRNEIPRGG